MKKTLIIILSIAALISMSSCYSSKVVVGEVYRDDRLVKVGSKKNAIFLYGLIPAGSTSEASRYVRSAEGYVIRTRMSFLDGFLGTLTGGIYTPTTTTYFVPDFYLPERR
jgi:hypothetical protein